MSLACMRTRAIASSPLETTSHFPRLCSRPVFHPGGPGGDQPLAPLLYRPGVLCLEWDAGTRHHRRGDGLHVYGA